MVSKIIESAMAASECRSLGAKYNNCPGPKIWEIPIAVNSVLPSMQCTVIGPET